MENLPGPGIEHGFNLSPVLQILIHCTTREVLINHIFIQSSTNGYLGGFHASAIVNNAVMNKEVQLFFSN